MAAMRLYEAAIESARTNGFVQHEGLAYELGARFYERRGFDTIARTYLREARSCYVRWGAEAEIAIPCIRDACGSTGRDSCSQGPAGHIRRDRSLSTAG
jgi:hypothetical protein